MTGSNDLRLADFCIHILKLTRFALVETAKCQTVAEKDPTCKKLIYLGFTALVWGFLAAGTGGFGSDLGSRPASGAEICTSSKRFRELPH